LASKKSKKKKKTKDATKSSKRAPQTMDELLDMYGGEVHGFSVGDKVEGEILSIESNRVVLDIGAKSEGIVAEKAFDEAKEYINQINEGDKVKVVVLVPETREGNTIVSLRHAAWDWAWDKLKDAKKKGEEVVVRGESTRSAGVMVEAFGLSGFIPMSQLSKHASKNPKDLIGKHFKVKVIELDRDNNKIVFSERAVSEAEDIELAQKAMEKVKEGESYKGEVTTITDFGCFVKISVKVDKEEVSLEGLVHISELAWEKVEKTKDVVSEGDKVKVIVINKGDGKLGFSMKQAQDDPWEKVEKSYKKDSKTKGKVVKVNDYGAFVEVEPGVEGLIHITKIPPGKRLEKGDEVKVYIEDVDKKNRRLSLGLVLTEKPVGYK
jgi:ribosomal protein S1